MNKILVWDIPNRIFHWAFAVALSAAMAIGFFVDDDQPLFQLHMLLGIVSLFLLAIRVIIGLVGSRYSRFLSFPVAPREVADYMKNALFSQTRLYAGNNPGSAMAALLMFILVPASFISGIGFGGEVFEELHGFFAWVLLGVIVLHLAGLGWHTLRHRENIALAMITGRKNGVPENAIASAQPVWGGIIILVAVLWIGALFANHNSETATVKLPLIGTTLKLGENESDGGE